MLGLKLNHDKWGPKAKSPNRNSWNVRSYMMPPTAYVPTTYRVGTYAADIYRVFTLAMVHEQSRRLTAFSTLSYYDVLPSMVKMESGWKRLWSWMSFTQMLFLAATTCVIFKEYGFVCSPNVLYFLNMHMLWCVPVSVSNDTYGVS